MLHQLLVESSSKQPEQIALVDKSRRLTYRQLDAQSDQLAAHLQNAGVAPGDRVGIYLDKSAEAVIAIFAVLKAGAAYVPLDPTSPVKRTAFLIADCQMKGLITDPQKYQGLAVACPALSLCLVMMGDLDSGEIVGAASRHDQNEDTSYANQTDEDLAYILYTSGSTGQPKGVMISHRAALAFVNWATAYVGLHPGDRVASHAPFHFDLSIFDLFATIKAGATVVLVPPELSIFPRNLAEWIEQSAITVWYSVPSVLTRLVLHGGLERHSFAHLRQILFAGEVFPVALLRQIQGYIPRAHYHNLYGPTETNVCTAYAVGAIPPDQIEPVPIGQACAGCELWVLDEQGQRCAPGIVGELYVSGPTLMQGYWALQEQTNSVFVLHPLRPTEKLYRTGDLVFQAEDGNYHFCGRRDSQVKRRGYRIELGEIEAVLQRHPAIAQAVVVALPETDLDTPLKAIVVTHPHSVITSAEVVRFCAEHLPAYMLPGTIEFRPHLPVTSTGKIDRLALQEG